MLPNFFVVSILSVFKLFFQFFITTVSNNPIENSKPAKANKKKADVKSVKLSFIKPTDTEYVYKITHINSEYKIIFKILFWFKIK